jgi:hypothetical protein
VFWNNLTSRNCIQESIYIRTYITMILCVVLCGRDIWSVIMREEHGLRVFESRVLRKISGAKGKR